MDTDLFISDIALGTASMGTSTKQDTSNQLLDAYLAFGGNLIDTARIYSPPEIGRSEHIVGNWLRQTHKRNQIVLMTKGGHPRLENMSQSRMTAKDMRMDLELSLRALQTEVIDIYFYHRDNLQQTVEDEIEVMEMFRREGKIRYYGCSNWDTKRMIAADNYCAKKGYRGFVANQALFNLGSQQMKPLRDQTMRKIDEKMFEYHVNHSQNLAMAYKGVAGGYFHRYLTDGAESVITSPYHTSENIQRAEKCRELMEKYQASISQIVLGFFMQQPFQCIPLYGAKKVSDLEDAMKTSEIKFEMEDFEFSSKKN